MRPSNVFIAIVVLVSTGLLILYGMMAFSPLQPKQAANANAQALTPLDAPKVDFGNPSRGATGAALTIVDFGDYLCGPCQQLETELNDALKNYQGKVRVVWKDFPNVQLHPLAHDAAAAARCAGYQGAFWEYHDVLMANQSSISADNFPIFATQVGIDGVALKACLDNKDADPLVDRDLEEGIRLRIDGTPYLFIGDRRVSGAIDEDQLKQLIDSALNRPKDAPQPDANAPAAAAPAPSPAPAP